MATPTTEFQFGGLTKCLIQAGLLAENDAQVHIQEAKKKQVPLVSHLVTNKLVSGRSLATVASTEFGVPFFDLDAIDVRSLPVKLISEKLIRKHQVLPLFSRGKSIFIAISDPTSVQGLDEIKFQSRLTPECILVEEDKLHKAIETALEAPDTAMADLLD
ncbi:MAG: hypothetical protein LUQ57_07045 [Methylococcaceae bacterium]|nr:hypothetical protein [Methylococcaceae bacterium]